MKDLVQKFKILVLIDHLSCLFNSLIITIIFIVTIIIIIIITIITILLVVG